MHERTSSELLNLRELPALDQLLRSSGLAPTILQWGRQRVKDAATQTLQALRAQLRDAPGSAAPDVVQLIAAVENRLLATGALPQVPVLNLSGTLIHTNLGRAQLPACAARAVADAAAAVSLEYDLRTGERGDRDAEVAALLCALTGAEAATAVNNTAAALLLVLNTLADAQRVPVARGELIEIGGSFRLPEIMARSGALLREIGTTNRTHANDYTRALAEGDAMVLRVHASNYEIKGFTHQEPDAVLATLAHQHGRPYVVDLGSGALIDLRHYGVAMEPMPQQVLAAGADLVLFSGDKLLGGPQAGLIVGRADLIQRINANPLKRALRLDKLSLAALAAVLKLYGDHDRLVNELPLLRHLGRDINAMKRTAHDLANTFAACFAPHLTLSACDTQAQLGSGAQPTTQIPSVALAFASTDGAKRLTLLSRLLREASVPVIGRIQAQQLLLDLRTLDDVPALQRALTLVADRFERELQLSAE